MTKRTLKNPIKYKIQLVEEQKQVKEAIINSQIVIITGRAGCLSKGTKVLMYDGTYKKVEDVEIGDKLMGIDSAPRNVTKLFRGEEQMYWVRQNKGDDYRVNESHVLSLKKVTPQKRKRITVDGKRRLDYNSELLHSKKEEVVNITVKEFINLKDYEKEKHYKGYIAPQLEFKNKVVDIDPYYLGLWLGDGNKDSCGITTTDTEVIDFLHKFFSDSGMECKNRKYLYTPSTSNKVFSENMIDVLRECVKHENKHVSFSSLYKHVKDVLGEKVPYRTTVSKDFNKFKELINYDLTQFKGGESRLLNNILFYLKKYDLINNKHIPNDYKFNSKKNRLKLLAGLIDSDGYRCKKGKYYEIIQKDKKLSDDIVYLCRTLGYKVNIKPKKATMRRNDGSIYESEVNRISILSNFLHEIPVKIERKKIKVGEISPFKNRELTGIKIEKDVVDNYYGFNLDKDNLFLLEDFTVTHNSGKSLICAQTALDLVFKKEVEEVLLTRATIEVGKTLGYLPGELTEKYNPYIEAFKDNLYKCYDKVKVDKHIENNQIQGFPIQFIRGKTIDSGQILILEESQNTTKHEMLAILTRLGKGGKIIINGDLEQSDIKDGYTGLHYAIELSKNIEDIPWFKLSSNHRSDLVGKILDYEYKKF